jgi:hypothetical protein
MGQMKSLFLSILFMFSSLLIASERIDKNGSIVLKGKVTLEQLNERKKFEWLASGVERYHPNQDIVDSLKAFKDFSLVVVLGTWCSDTKEQLPKLIKVLQQMNYPLKSIQLIAVGRDKKVPRQFRNYTVQNVPTIFVLRQNNVIGKVVETPIKSMEEDVLEILRKQK